MGCKRLMRYLFSESEENMEGNTLLVQSHKAEKWNKIPGDVQQVFLNTHWLWKCPDASVRNDQAQYCVFFLGRKEKCKKLAFDPHCNKNSVPQWVRPETNSLLGKWMKRKKIQCSEMPNTTCLSFASSPCLPSPFARGRQVRHTQRQTMRNPLGNEAGLLKYLVQILKLMLLHCPYCIVQRVYLVQARFFSDLSAWELGGWFMNRFVCGIAFAPAQSYMSLGLEWSCTCEAIWENGRVCITIVSDKELALDILWCESEK